ncbi:hypothetical protein niasHT_006988 [Heterodera trifolii]|uniref:Uncharacterized protein n=1 Tax=Heterodera trifolii TaxID=157864 RepID=A0ABD2LMT0_9BILA
MGPKLVKKEKKKREKAKESAHQMPSSSSSSSSSFSSMSIDSSIVSSFTSGARARTDDQRTRTANKATMREWGQEKEAAAAAADEQPQKQQTEGQTAEQPKFEKGNQRHSSKSQVLMVSPMVRSNAFGHKFDQRQQKELAQNSPKKRQQQQQKQSEFQSPTKRRHGQTMEGGKAQKEKQNGQTKSYGPTEHRMPMPTADEIAVSDERSQHLMSPAKMPKTPRANTISDIQKKLNELDIPPDNTQQQNTVESSSEKTEKIVRLIRAAMECIGFLGANSKEFEERKADKINVNEFFQWLEQNIPENTTKSMLDNLKSKVKDGQMKQFLGEIESECAEFKRHMCEQMETKGRQRSDESMGRMVERKKFVLAISRLFDKLFDLLNYELGPQMGGEEEQKSVDSTKELFALVVNIREGTRNKLIMEAIIDELHNEAYKWCAELFNLEERLRLAKLAILIAFPRNALKEWVSKGGGWAALQRLLKKMNLQVFVGYYDRSKSTLWQGQLKERGNEIRKYISEGGKNAMMFNKYTVTSLTALLGQDILKTKNEENLEKEIMQLENLKICVKFLFFLTMKRRVRAVIEDEEEEENGKNGGGRSGPMVIHSSSSESEEEEANDEDSSDRRKASSSASSSSSSQQRTPMKATTNIKRMVRYQTNYYQSDEEDFIGAGSYDEEEEANFVVPDDEIEEDEGDGSASDSGGERESGSDGAEQEEVIGRRKKKRRRNTARDNNRNRETPDVQFVRVSKRIQRNEAKKAELVDIASERNREQQERKRRMGSDSPLLLEDVISGSSSADPSTSDDNLSDFIVNDEEDDQNVQGISVAGTSRGASSSANINASSTKRNGPPKKRKARAEESPERRLQRLPIREMTTGEELLRLADDDRLWTFPDELVLRVVGIDHCSAVDQGYPPHVQCQFFKILLGNDAGSTVELHAWWHQQRRIEDEVEIGKAYIFYTCQVFLVAPCRAQFNEGTVPIMLSFTDETEIEECRIDPIAQKNS